METSGKIPRLHWWDQRPKWNGLLSISRNWHRVQNEIIQLGMNPAGFQKGLHVTALLHQVVEEKLVQQSWGKINLCVCVHMYMCACNLCQTTRICNQCAHGIFFWWQGQRAMKIFKKHKSQLKKHCSPSWLEIRNYVCKGVSWSPSRLSPSVQGCLS